MSITFGIVGRIPSKKNSKRILRVRGRTIVACSKDYAKWQKENLEPLRLGFGGAKKLNALGGRYSVKIEFTVGDRRAFDLTNKAESIMDLMVDAGVIDDDNFNVVPSVTLKYAGYEKGRWYALVKLEDA